MSSKASDYFFLFFRSCSNISITSVTVSLVVHGIGESLWCTDDVSIPDFQECVAKFRKRVQVQQAVVAAGHSSTPLYTAETAKSASKKNAKCSKAEPSPAEKTKVETSEEQANKMDLKEDPPSPEATAVQTRIEMIPIEWHKCVHSAELEITSNIDLVTLPNIDLLRKFGKPVQINIQVAHS